MGPVATLLSPNPPWICTCARIRLSSAVIPEVP